MRADCEPPEAVLGRPVRCRDCVHLEDFEKKRRGASTVHVTRICNSEHACDLQGIHRPIRSSRKAAGRPRGRESLYHLLQIPVMGRREFADESAIVFPKVPVVDEIQFPVLLGRPKVRIANFAACEACNVLRASKSASRSMSRPATGVPERRPYASRHCNVLRSASRPPEYASKQSPAS